MRVSVILSTYRQPGWLRKALWGYARQVHRDFEVVVADDGSGEDTAAVVAEAGYAHPGLRIVHVWHRDRGYRKCAILNRAVLASTGEYLIFSDGDCIPRRDFVAVHAHAAAPGVYLSGGAVRLPEQVSKAIAEQDVDSGRAFEVGWLRAAGYRPGRHALRLLGGTAMPRLLDAITPTRATWNGNNASTWKRAVLTANGFEHEMGYGGQDREFGERLDNLGFVGRRVRYRALLLHLDHGRPYRSAESIRKNKALRALTRSSGAVRARCGIAELEPEADAFVRQATTGGANG